VLLTLGLLAVLFLGREQEQRRQSHQKRTMPGASWQIRQA